MVIVMKKINEIIDTSYDIDIRGITDDSRLVSEGYLFVATKGFNVDHFDYIKDAVDRGASFVISDRKIDISIPYVVVNNINEVFDECCRKFYDVHPDCYKLVGVTGTDGKTTTTSLVGKIVSDFACLGTNGLSVSGKEYKTDNTTPCISELYKNLKLIEENNINNVVMEVSSEALLHGRVDSLRFDVIGFTNITEDHLNVHGSIDAYIGAKLKLLKLVKDDGYVVVNGDDLNLKKIKHKNLYTFGFDNSNDFKIEEVNYLENITIIRLCYRDEEFTLRVRLHGKYNIYNSVMAFVIGYLLGEDVDVLLTKLSEVSSINGRGEEIDFLQDFKIILDYAHTINGIKSILEFYEGKFKRIITVTGCAGGREKSKRRTIGDLVMDMSDVAIFTMDDPRYESVDDIIDEMVGDRNDYIRICDRVSAINYALSSATLGDVVLILGTYSFFCLTRLKNKITIELD